jgi:glutamate-1-semialdehyde 2,1-aminomutase
MNRDTSKELFDRSKRHIPGGVNSPARTFDNVGGTPPFIERAEGPYIFDEDGNRYLDFVLSWGPAIMGHADEDVVTAAKQAVEMGSSFGAPTRREIEMVELMVDYVEPLDVARLVNSGTEACMSAIRVARGATGRDKIIKFKGCYHGHGDSFLIAAGSGALTLGEPDSPGVTEGTAKDTLVARFNDVDSVEQQLDAHPDDVAAVILEPVCGNAGCIPPNEGFLESLRELTANRDVLLIFDEVMTGFRLDQGGAAARFDIEPDLFCFGKVAGGGFPLAAFGGKESVMRQVAPDGPVYQAGTLSGNPVAVAAGKATLEKLDQQVYDTLEIRGAQLESGLQTIIDSHDYPMSTNRVGSMFSLFFAPGPIDRKSDLDQYDQAKFNQFFNEMLDRGYYLAPSQFEAGFLSTAHTEPLINEFLNAVEATLDSVFE